MGAREFEALDFEEAMPMAEAKSGMFDIIIDVMVAAISTKMILNKYGYFNNNILFYGWDDDDLKINWKNNNIILKNLEIDDKFIFHIESDNKTRVSNYNNNFGFFTNNISNENNLYKN